MMALPSSAGARPLLRPGPKLRQLVRSAKALVPRPVRDHMALHHEVSRLLREQPRLARVPLCLSRRLRLRLRLGKAHRAVGHAHVAEAAVFVAGKTVPEPITQAAFYAAEGLAFAGLQKLETRVMEHTLLAAERRHHRHPSARSSHALRWLHGRLTRKQRKLSRKGVSTDASRYRNWHLLKRMERELEQRGAQP